MKAIHHILPVTLTMLLIASLILVGCDSPQPTAQPTATEATSLSEATSTDPDAGLAELMGKVFSTGPNNETATLASDITLTDEELQNVRDMEATAAIIMHYGDNDWSNAQVAGLTTQFEVMGIEVVHESEAGFEADQQAANIETALASNPDIIVAFPLAPAEVFKQAADQGVKVVFMDMLPSGEVELEHGKDYVSVVSADSYGNGIASAHLMARYLNGSGTIGIIFHQVDFFVTYQRYEALKKTIQDHYPDIEIVAEAGMEGPDYAAEAEQITATMLADHPNLDGIWVVWDVPAEGVMTAAQAAGREDLAITTIDLGLNMAVALAEGNMVVGVGAQRPFDQGVTEAKLAAYALLGKDTPAYVVLSALPVSQEDVIKSWQVVYHQTPPDILANAAE